MFFSMLFAAVPKGNFPYNVALSLNVGIEFKASIVMFSFYIVTILLAEFKKKNTEHTSTMKERQR